MYELKLALRTKNIQSQTAIKLLSDKAVEGMMIRLMCMIILFLSLIGCGRGYRDYELDKLSFDSQAMKMVQDETSITLPAGTRGLHLYYKAPIDPWFIAKMAIPKTAEGAFTHQISLLPGSGDYLGLEGTAILDASSAKVTWWHPKNITLNRTSGNGKDDTRVYAILCHEGDELMFYVLWFAPG